MVLRLLRRLFDGRRAKTETQPDTSPATVAAEPRRDLSRGEWAAKHVERALEGAEKMTTPRGKANRLRNDLEYIKQVYATDLGDPEIRAEIDRVKARIEQLEAEE